MSNDEKERKNIVRVRDRGRDRVGTVIVIKYIYRSGWVGTVIQL